MADEARVEVATAIENGANGKAVTKRAPALARLSSLRVDRLRFARKAGLQFAGERDIYTAAGYLAESRITFDHYWSLYERNPVAGRLVDMPANTTWRRPPIVREVGVSEQETSEFEEDFLAMAKRTKLWSWLRRVDRMSRIGHYGALLIGVRGDELLREEMPTLEGQEDVLFFKAFDEGDLRIAEWDDDVRSPRFGQPILYDIDLSSNVSGFSMSRRLVHWTRIIHVAEDKVKDEVHGRPPLKRLLNTIFDMEKIQAGTGEAFWQLASKILHANIDLNADISDSDLDDLGEAMEEIVHDLRRQIITKGGDVGWLSGETPDPSSPIDMIQILVTMGSGIPKRIFFGTETGERASEQDERQWFGTIAERQIQHAEPDILRPLIDRLAEFGAFEFGEEGYAVEWPNLFVPSEESLGELSASNAKAAKDATAVGADPRDLIEIGTDGVLRLRATEVEDGSEG